MNISFSFLTLTVLSSAEAPLQKNERKFGNGKNNRKEEESCAGGDGDPRFFTLSARLQCSSLFHCTFLICFHHKRGLCGGVPKDLIPELVSNITK